MPFLKGREKERLGEKDIGERSGDRWIDRQTDPSNKWTEGQTDRQTSGDML